MKKLEMTKRQRKEHLAELNRKRVSKCMENKDQIGIIAPKGTKDRIRATGKSINVFVNELIEEKLKELGL